MLYNEIYILCVCICICICIYIYIRVHVHTKIQYTKKSIQLIYQFGYSGCNCFTLHQMFAMGDHEFRRSINVNLRFPRDSWVICTIAMLLSHRVLGDPGPPATPAPICAIRCRSSFTGVSRFLNGRCLRSDMTYSLVMTKIAIQNGHSQWVFP